MVCSTIIHAIDYTTYRQDGRVVKGVVLGTSPFGGVGSSPTPVILLAFLYKVMFPFF